MFMQANQTAAATCSNSLCRDLGHDWRTTTTPNYRTCQRARRQAAQLFHHGRWMDATTRPAHNRTGSLSSHTEQATMTWVATEPSQQGARRMQAVHIIFPLARFHTMVSAFEEQFEAQQEEVVVVDFGCSYKLQQGYIVIKWSDTVSPNFIEQLDADRHVLDFTIYGVPCSTDGQFSLLEQAL